MNKRIKIIISFGIFALFIALSLFAFNSLRANINPQISIQNHLSQKEKAADFMVIDSEGKEIKLSDMEGMPVVLNFWASWCPPCKSEMPEFESAYKELGGEIQFMMVDLVDGSRETIEKGSAYISEQGFEFPVYFDTSSEAAIAYGITAIPTTIFIDADGYVVTTFQGSIDKNTLSAGIDMIK